MAYDYSTPELVADELQTTDSFSASTLPSLSAVTTWIQEESAQINQDTGIIWGQTSYSDVINWDGSDIIYLKNSPIISITDLLYTTANIGSAGYGLTNTAIAETDYTSYEERGEVHLLFGSGSTKFKEGLKTIQVDYSAGYATTPLVIQKYASKIVALRVLNTLLSKNNHEGSNGGSVSVGSISIVEPADFGTGSYKQLKQDVTDLERTITTGTTGVFRYNNY